MQGRTETGTEGERIRQSEGHREIESERGRDDESEGWMDTERKKGGREDDRKRKGAVAREYSSVGESGRGSGKDSV